VQARHGGVELLRRRELAAERKGEQEWKNRERQAEPERGLPESVPGHPLLYPWRVIAYWVGRAFSRIRY
jgi:hypothetical protein